jgi:hypothetical protein
LLKQHARQSFATAQAKATSAERQRGAGETAAATGLFQDAVVALNVALGEATEARTAAEAAIRELQVAVTNSDGSAAVALLAKAEQRAPQDLRLPGLRHRVKL